MNKFLAALGLSTALAAATALPLATQAEAAMSYGGQGVADLQHQIAPVEKAQFFFWGGYNWCWYPWGWHGPGWYWCDYEWDNGYGWGGPYGWNGWFVSPYWRHHWRTYGHHHRWPHNYGRAPYEHMMTGVHPWVMRGHAGPMGPMHMGPMHMGPMHMGPMHMGPMGHPGGGHPIWIPRGR